MLLDSGARALAALMSGDDSMAARGMYLEYSNGAVTPDEVEPDRALSYYTALEAPKGFIRVVGVSARLLLEDAAKVRMVFHAAGGQVVDGPALVDGVSRVYSLALVAMPDVDDPSKDVPIAAVNLDGQVVKPANASMGGSISVDFPKTPVDSE